MDSDKEVNSAKNLTPFSIADILSGSSKSTANPPVVPSTPPPNHPVAHPYPWFLFNHPSWALMMPDGSARNVDNGTDGQAGSSAINAVSSPEEDDDRLSDTELFDDDEEDDGSNSMIGSLTSTDDGQQEDPLDMRASHGRSRSRKSINSIKTKIEIY